MQMRALANQKLLITDIHHVLCTFCVDSVEAIMQPQVKLALRTSGHLLLGVCRIYSRKAKYLLADCNEAFVKIKMAFRPGVVDLPEENREAAVAAITLQENFHDFDTTLADLNDFDVQAQFSVNQSRPEEITMREDLSSITFVGDDGFGDIGFDDREILRDATSFEESLYKQPDHEPLVEEKTLNENANEKPMDVDNDIHAPMDDDLSPVDGGFMDDDDDVDDDGGGFGGGVDQEFFGDDDFMNSGGLFEDAPVADVSMPQKRIRPKIPEELEPAAPQTTSMASIVGPAGEQTTLINNEEEAFALPPLDATIFPGTEGKRRRKRKLIVDEQKGFPGETMKLQLSDTSDIISTLDLAPPTKKLMHWKETGVVEKLFSLPGRNIVSKVTSKLFSRNLITKQVKDDEPEQEDFLQLEEEEIARNDKSQDKSRAREEFSTIMEEPSILDASVKSNLPDRQSIQPAVDRQSIQPTLQDTTNPQDLLVNTFTEEVPQPQLDVSEPQLPQPQFDQYEDPPSIAPFSVPPPSVPPPSVPPQAEVPGFRTDEDLENELMPENEEQEEKRLTKRTHQMQHALELAFRYNNRLSFAEM
ncbi:MCD1 [Mytilus edulis]|uniref:SCC1 n=1 Tax=Mytilus edulis TaxID=6550 RepID=A0A8S3TK86_MYTED|nr:MCD1 [Mytilus edulis]